MPKYMLSVSLSLEGLKGTMKEGGSARRAVTEKAIKSVGGTLEAFYYAFGGTDVFAIVDLPDNVAAATVATTVASTGVGSIKTTVLLMPEEVDEIGKRSVEYRPPGA